MKRLSYELAEPEKPEYSRTCLTVCPFQEGMKVGSIVCRSKCKYNLHTDEIVKIVKCGADTAFNHQEGKSIWMRLGIILTGSQEDIEKVLQGDKEALHILLQNRQYKVEGDTYIPDESVSDYNNTTKTNFEEETINFEL